MNILTDKDLQLKTIPNLSWLPWIGSNYFKNTSRLLIIGESQYAKGETAAAFQEDLARVNGIDFTRNSVLQTQIQNHYKHPALDNLLKALVGNASIGKEKLWKEIAFYNFVQRVMDYSSFNGKKTEQPTIADFDEGWKVFVEVVKILKPTDCIFIGVSAAMPFERMMDRLNIKRTDRTAHAKIGNTTPMSASIEIEGHTTKISFVRHSSAYFSAEEWTPFLAKQHGKIIEELTKYIL
ncbi:hypothetical protein [Kaistella palustris]|uniref:hypothetical protein n=1 Tax=Kaistella palustris TaxID=493376 RepID=UPI00040D602B|nr:hypothetical protein [Kaistella palustris]